MMEVVNGYPCRNCTDVENAKKGVDPAKPKDGLDGTNAQNQPVDFGPAVKFDGAMTGVSRTDRPAPDAYAPGKVADFKA